MNVRPEVKPEGVKMEERLDKVEQKLNYSLSKLQYSIQALQETVLGFNQELQDLVRDVQEGVSITRLRQTGSLAEFNEKFDSVSAKLEWPEEYLVKAYVRALKEEIADSVLLFNPRTMQEARRMARVQEIALNWKAAKNAGSKNSLHVTGTAASPTSKNVSLVNESCPSITQETVRIKEDWSEVLDVGAQEGMKCRNVAVPTSLSLLDLTQQIKQATDRTEEMESTMNEVEVAMRDDLPDFRNTKTFKSLNLPSGIYGSSNFISVRILQELLHVRDMWQSEKNTLMSSGSQHPYGNASMLPCTTSVSSFSTNSEVGFSKNIVKCSKKLNSNEIPTCLLIFEEERSNIVTVSSVFSCLDTVPVGLKWNFHWTKTYCQVWFKGSLISMLIGSSFVQCPMYNIQWLKSCLLRQGDKVVKEVCFAYDGSQLAITTSPVQSTVKTIPITVLSFRGSQLATIFWKRQIFFEVQGLMDFFFQDLGPTLLQSWFLPNGPTRSFSTWFFVHISATRSLVQIWFRGKLIKMLQGSALVQSSMFPDSMLFGSAPNCSRTVPLHLLAVFFPSDSVPKFWCISEVVYLFLLDP